jgi:CRP-like cAMP-binding protein
VFNITSEKTYQDGQIIIAEGNSWNGIYVLVSGTVEISKTVGGKKSIIELLKEGEMFGEVDFLGGITRTATVRAIGETTVGIIDRASLDKEFNRLSSGFRTILLAVVRRFKKMIDRTYAFSSRKEARVLTSLSLRYEDKKSFVDAFKR